MIEIGDKFGVFVVLNRSERPCFWICECDVCGNVVTKRADDLINGRNEHCDNVMCFRPGRGRLSSRFPREYSAWSQMRSHHSGEVCERWSVFWAFFEDMGKRPLNTYLGRVDESREFGPENCKWRRYNFKSRGRHRLITIDGETKLFSDWCDHFDIDRRVVYLRLHRGWPLKDAFTRPIDTSRRHKSKR